MLDETNLPKKVNFVFEKYKPLIYKKASLYSRCSKGRIDRDDFVSDVYEKLYYFVSKIDKSKIKDIEKFSYYTSVRYAIFSVYKKERKIIDNEIFIPEDEEGQPLIQFESKCGISELAPDISKFDNSLSRRQKIIKKELMKGKKLLDISKSINMSYGIVHLDIYKMRLKYKEFFC